LSSCIILCPRYHYVNRKVVARVGEEILGIIIETNGPEKGAGIEDSSTETDHRCSLLVKAFCLELRDERLSRKVGIEPDPRQDCPKVPWGQQRDGCEACSTLFSQ
jgi:hypothetical protein